MTDEVRDELVEIRTFALMDEIRLLPGFKENNPLNKDNYKCIVGDYWFPDEIKCCREESNGHLCGEKHKWGFVAKLKDNSITVIGNHCAKDKFGADAKIKSDRSRYLNEKRRREKITQLEDLRTEKTARLAKLEALSTLLKQIQTRTKDFLALLGEQTRRRLQDMSRSENSTVFVQAVTYREYIDENGDRQKERRAAPARLGALNGLTIIDEKIFKSMYSSIRVVRQGLEAIDSVTENTKTTELEYLVNTINDLGRIESEIGKIEKDENLFFNSDLSLLCFIVDDKSERYKAARVFLERSGEIVGRDKAKTWLAEKDQELKKKLTADRIEIRY